MFRKFSPITSSNIFSGPFSLSPSGTRIIWMLACLMLFQRSVRLSSFFFSFFFSSVAVIYTIFSSRSFIRSSASVILLLIPSNVLFICLFFNFSRSLVNIFFASAQSLPPFFSRDPGSSSLLLIWIIFLEGCLSPLYLVVFLWPYLVPSFGT